MTTTKNLAMVALAALLASPLSAQVLPGGGTAGDRIEEARRRTEEARRRAEEARTGARIDSGFLRTGRTSRSSSRVPPGHLPPRGLCRVWIDGVPPGQQPPVTDCATAEQMRMRTANSRVIYGDRESFPGKGKGKFKNQDRDRDDWFKDDDDRFEQDRGKGRSKLAKAERKAAKAARKGGRGRG